MEGFKISKIFDKNPIRNILPTPNTFALATAKPIEQVTPVSQDKGTYNVLFLGYGGGGHSGGGLMDSIIVAHVDLNTKKSALQRGFSNQASAMLRLEWAGLIFKNK